MQFQDIFSSEGFHPHGFCYLWRPELITLHVVSDVLIGLAYVGIGWGLAHFVRRSRGELPFSRMFIAFGIFIAACGATHFVEVWTLWDPAYWIAGGVKAITAAASVFTALALPPLIPVALDTLASARLSEQRRKDLEVAHGRLLELDETKTRFFANVSHELRTPLTLILGPLAQVLDSESITDEDRRRLETVRRNAGLLLRHVNDLLDVARLDARRLELSYRRVDLTRLVRRACAHFESAGQSRRIGVVVDTPDALPAELDPDQVERVLMNLLGNAVKFTPDGGTVSCSLDIDRGEVAHLVVADSGPGVPADERDRLFEPYRQADTISERGRGSGLGLAIVREIVELHGGRVRIEDAELGGAAFVVELPVRAPDGVAVETGADLEASGEAAAAEAGAPGAGARRPRERGAALEALVGRPRDARRQPDPVGDPSRPLVLVVEDNADMNALVVEALQGDYRVARAFDGREGIERALELRPDLIVSDVMMPEASGETLVRELRRHLDPTTTPILLLTARADEEIRLRLLRQGAQDYLTKPFSAEELRARARNWMETKRARDVLQRALETTQADVEALATEIVERKRDLEDALGRVRLALEEAQAANRAKTDFLAVMSHELRTPLNGIVGYLDLLEAGVREPLTEGQRAYVGRARASTRHLLRLVEEVLTFTSIDAGRERVEREEIDVRAIVEEASGDFASAAERKNLDLAIDLPEAPVVLETDPGKLRQIVSNLVANAVKFTDEGHVGVLLEDLGEEVAIAVRDTGPGILPEHRGRIFEPFWQADTTTTRVTGGTGLGLAIVGRLVDLLGGTLEVRGDPGDGTTFEVRLPRGS